MTQHLNEMTAEQEENAAVVKVFKIDAPNPWYKALERPTAFISAVVSHLGLGLSPVFSRYLQRLEHPIPPMSILIMTYLVVTLVYMPKIIFKVTRHLIYYFWEKPLTKEHAKHLVTLFWKDFLLNWRLWLYVAALVIRCGTAEYASQFTSAVYVILIGLLSPFFIVLIISVLMRNTREGKVNKITWKTFAALVATLLGSVIIILGGITDPKSPQGGKPWYDFIREWNVQWSELGQTLTSRDAIGLTLAFFSAIFLSVYIVLVRELKTACANTSASVITTGDGMLMFQYFSIMVPFVIPSVALEDWSPWLELDWRSWLVFSAYSLIVIWMSQLTGLVAIQVLGATIVGAALPLRIVSAIICSAILLKENLASGWQIVGSVIVLLSISIFLYLGHVQQQQFIEAEKQKENIQIVIDKNEYEQIN
jgi:drug/metabolite transporter (DMT)-like permease